jgi:TolB-like protein
MRFFAFFLPMLLFFFLPLFSLEEKPKVLILPFAEKFDTNKYSTANTTCQLLFHSLYSFIGLMPTVEVPDRERLISMAARSSDVRSLAETEKADYVIGGDVQFRGDVYGPTARITLRVWSRSAGRLVLEKDWETPTGFEFFDTVDDIIRDFVKEVLKTSMNLATIRFDDFHVGDGQYDIVVNGKQIAIVSNDSFSMPLRVLSDADYQITFRRLCGAGMTSRIPVVVLNRFVKLTAGSVENIGFRSVGTVTIHPAKNLGSLSLYTFLLNDRMVPDGTVLSNIDASGEMRYRIMEDETNVAWETNFYLGDNSQATIDPEISAGNIRVGKIRNRKPGAVYHCLLNGKEISEDFVWTNRRAETTNEFLLLENETNLLERDTFVLHSGEDYLVQPAASPDSFVHFRVMFNDSSLAGIAMEIFPVPDFSATLFAGFNYVDLSRYLGNGSNYCTASAGLEGGWYFLELFDRFLRFGFQAGVRTQYLIANDGVKDFLTEQNLANTLPEWTVITAGWLSAEAEPFGIGVIIRAGFGYDWMQRCWLSSSAGKVVLPLVFSLGVRF